MKNVLLLLLAVVTCVSANAQDIHFSQFYLSPLNLNPALTGVMNCNKRLTANYRNQWASIVRSGVYNTYNASYDQKFTSGRYDNWGLGATFWGDVAGSADFGTSTFKVSGSYAKRLGGGRRRSHYLSFGADFGIAQRSVDFLELRWGNQYTGTEYNPDLPSGEGDFDLTSYTYANIGAGLLWFSNFGKDANVYGGVAYHNLNRPAQSFNSVEDDYSLYSRFTVHAGGEVPITSGIGVVPGVVFMHQGPSMQLNLGTSVKFRLGNSRYNSQAFHLGSWVRLAKREEAGILTDALILQTRFDYNQYTLGFSYDVNLSNARMGTNGQGGFELALQYKFCGKERRGVYCPDF